MSTPFFRFATVGETATAGAADEMREDGERTERAARPRLRPSGIEKMEDNLTVERSKVEVRSPRSERRAQRPRLWQTVRRGGRLIRRTASHGPSPFFDALTDRKFPLVRNLPPSIVAPSGREAVGMRVRSQGIERTAGREDDLRRGGEVPSLRAPPQPSGDNLPILLAPPTLPAVAAQRAEETRQRLIGRCVIHDGGTAQEPADPTDVETGVLFVRDSAPEQVLTEGCRQRFGLFIAQGKSFRFCDSLSDNAPIFIARLYKCSYNFRITAKRKHKTLGNAFSCENIAVLGKPSYNRVQDTYYKHNPSQICSSHQFLTMLESGGPFPAGKGKG